MPAHYFAAVYEIPPTAGEVIHLVDPQPVDREVYVQEIPIGATAPPSDQPVTSIDTNPDMDGGGFTLPERTFEFALAANYGLHAAVSDPALVDSIQVLVVPPHHR